MPEPTLKDLLQRRETIVAPGAWDAITARLFRHMGFKAIFVPAAQTAMVLGTAPGLLTATELAMVAERVSEGVQDEVPVIADAGEGFGSLGMVARTVELLEDASISAIVLSAGAATPEYVRQRIETAVNARRSENFLIFAAVPSGAEAKALASAARDAGANVIAVEATDDIEGLRRLRAQVSDVPMAAFSGHGSPGVRELEAAGYRVVLFPMLSLQASLRAVHDTWKSVADTGHLLPQREDSMPLINKLLELEEKWAVEKQTTEAGVEVPGR